MEYYLAIKRTKQLSFATTKGFAGGTRNKEPASNAEDVRDAGSVPGLGKPPGGGHGKPTPVFLPGESHGHRSLAGYSPWGLQKSFYIFITNHISNIYSPLSVHG